MKASPKTAGKIASAALRLLERGGENRVTMRSVARAVGITPMAIYHHFPSREALLRKITDAEFEKLSNAYQAYQKPSSPEASVFLVVDWYLDYAFAHPRVFDYVFSRCRPDARRFPEDFRARRSPTLNLTADAVSEGMSSGLLKNDDVWEVALTIWAHVHGYVMLYRGGRFDLSQDEFRALVHRSMRRLFDGLKT